MSVGLVLLSLFAASFANVEYDGRLNIRLEHCFGSEGAFVDRGNVTVQSVRSGTYSLEQTYPEPEQLAALRDPANRDQLYKLRSTAQAADGSESVFLSSVKFSTLLENGLHDTIKVWLLSNGAVAAVGISPSPSASRSPLAPEMPAEFSSEVYILHAEQAPAPDTAGYIQKLEREREAREKGDFKDNRSFIAKYWMYIVPVVIFVLLSGAANPDQQAAAR